MFHFRKKRNESIYDFFLSCFSERIINKERSKRGTFQLGVVVGVVVDEGVELGIVVDEIMELGVVVVVVGNTSCDTKTSDPPLSELLSAVAVTGKSVELVEPMTKILLVSTSVI